MSLTIISNHPIETVSSWIKSYFATVKEKDFELNYKNQKFPFPDSYLAKISWMKAVAKENCLYIIIPFEEMYSKYKEKPLEFLNSFLSNTGNGTLISLLKNLGLVYNVESETIFKASFSTLLQIKFTLTKKGFNNQPLILEYFYTYIKLIASNGVNQKYYEELETIQLINFNFNENKMKIEDEASQLSHNQNYYPTRDVLTCDYLFENFNETIIYQVLNNITISKSLLIVSSNNFVESSDEASNANVIVDSDINLSISNSSKTFNSLFTQPSLQTYNTMFKLSHAISGIPEELIQDIENFNISELSQQIQFQEDNQYLQQDFKILTECKDNNKNEDTENYLYQSCFSHQTSENFSEIMQILNTSETIAWFKFDQTFKIPKFSIYNYFLSPLTFKTIDNYVLTQLIAYYLNDFAQEKFSQAIDIGYEINFEADYQGLQLRVNGFREKLMDLFSDLLFSIKNITINEERFKLIKEQYKTKIDNNMEAYLQAFQKLKLFLFEYNYDPQLQLENLNQVQFSSLETFLSQFFQTFQIQAFIIGDIGFPAAQYIANLYKNVFNFSAPDQSSLLKQRIRNFINKSFVYRCNNSSPFDSNQLVLNYYQNSLQNYIYAGNFSKDQLLQFEAKYQIIADQLNSDAFNYLRTEHQLGYIVSTQMTDFYGIKGLLILIQGVEENVNTYDEEIENFLTQMKNIYETMDSDYFQILKSSAINNLKKKDIKFDDMADKYWKESNLFIILNICFKVSKQTYLFDRKVQTVEFLQKLNSSDILDFYLNLISGKLSIQLLALNNQISYEIINSTKQYNNTIQNKLVSDADILQENYFS